MIFYSYQIMEAFMKIRLFSLIYFSICISLSLLSADQLPKTEPQIIEEIVQFYKQKYDAHIADPEIDEIAQEALEKCGIRQPIIILQNDTLDTLSNNAHICGDPLFKNPQLVMVIGTKRTYLDQMIASIYHEIGHIVNNDVSIEIASKKIQHNKKALMLSALSMPATYFLLSKHVRSTPLKFAASAVSGLAIFTNHFLNSQYKKKEIEQRADRFMYENLIKHNKLTTAIGHISDYLFNEEKRKSLPWFATGYPTDLERAKMGITILQEQGIDISELLHNLPEELDEGIKKTFPQQIKKWFPHLTKETK